MVHAGVCALAVGKATSETAKVNIRNKAIALAFFLLKMVIFLFSPFF
jgi:hypothetical protein